MTECRHTFIPEGSWFFTVNLAERNTTDAPSCGRASHRNTCDAGERNSDKQREVSPSDQQEGLSLEPVD